MRTGAGLDQSQAGIVSSLTNQRPGSDLTQAQAAVVTSAQPMRDQHKPVQPIRVQGCDSSVTLAEVK